MKYITEVTLYRHGISCMEINDREILLQFLNRELELMVGTKLAERLTDRQRREFRSLEDDETRTLWVKKNVSDYSEVVEQCSEHLLLMLTNKALGYEHLVFQDNGKNNI